MIHSIKAKGMKGGDWSYELGPLTFITGGSMSGKSRILEGIIVFLLGYLPKLGKRPMDTFLLATGREMSISGQMVPGGNWQVLRWKREGGSVKFNPVGAALVPETMLDFAEFRSKSGPKRTEYIISQCDLGAMGYTAESILAKLQNAEPEEVKALTRPMRDDAVRLLHEKTQQWRSHEGGFNEWLEVIKGWLENMAKTAKDAVEQCAGAIKNQVTTTEQLAARSSAQVGNDINDTNKAIGALEERLSKLQTGPTRRIIEDQLSQMPDHTVFLIQADVTLGQIRKSMEGFEDTVDEKYQQLEPIMKDFNHADALVTARNESRAMFQKQLDELASEECCPHCGAKGKGWRKHLEASLTSKLKGIDDDIETVTIERDALNMQVEVAKSIYDRAMSARYDYQARVKNLNELTTVYNSRRREQDQRDALMQQVKTAPETVDNGDALRQDVQKLKAQLADLRKEQVQASSMDAAKLNREKTLQRMTAAEAEHGVYKAMVKVLKQEQTDMVTKAIGSMLDTARKFTTGILPGRLDYHQEELGQWLGNQWVSVDTFSGTEKAIAYAAFSVALAQQSPFKLVLIDEMGVMDDRYAVATATRMKELLKEKVIDQAVLVDRDAGRYGGMRMKADKVIDAGIGPMQNSHL